MESNEVELSSFTQLDPLVPFSAYCEERVKSVLRYRFNFTYGDEVINRSHLIDIAVVPNEEGERSKVLVRFLDTFDGSVTSRTFHKDSEDMDTILAFFKKSMYNVNTMFMYKVARDVVNLFQEDFKQTSSPLSYEVFCRLVDSCFPSIKGRDREKQVVHKYQPEGSKYSVILSIERPYADITLIDNQGVYLVNTSVKENLFKEYNPVNLYDVYTNVCGILTKKLEENQWKS